jgi:UDP-2-acetamido-2-deoxy-ribo-hexuluronate aminotransferase
VANKYFDLLEGIEGIELPKIEDYCLPVYHLFVIKTDKREQLQEYLKERGVDTIIHYPISISELECMKNEIVDTDLNTSLKNSKRILSLPMYPELEEEEIRYVCDNIREYFCNNNLL